MSALKCLICTLVCVYSQAVTGLDLPSDEMKELQKKKLPEAIDNMYLIARRVQARFAQIPNRPVGSIESVFGLEIIHYNLFITLLAISVLSFQSVL